MMRRCAIWISPGATRTKSNWSKLTPKSRACSAPMQSPDPMFTDTLELDLGSVVPSLAGPRRPQDRVPLTESKKAFKEALPSLMKSGNANKSVAVQMNGGKFRA